MVKRGISGTFLSLATIAGVVIVLIVALRLGTFARLLSSIRRGQS